MCDDVIGWNTPDKLSKNSDYEDERKIMSCLSKLSFNQKLQSSKVQKFIDRVKKNTELALPPGAAGSEPSKSNLLLPQSKNGMKPRTKRQNKNSCSNHFEVNLETNTQQIVDNFLQTSKFGQSCEIMLSSGSKKIQA